MIPLESSPPGRCERVEHGGWALHRHVAALVRRGPAQERDVDRPPGIEQELLAAELDASHDVLGRHVVQPPAVGVRVDERFEVAAVSRPGRPAAVSR
jgi:hypothetical protein